MRRGPYLVMGAALLAACSESAPTDLAGVQKIAYIHRSAGETGNVFDYARGAPGDARSDIYTLAPPTASGKKTNLTNLGPGGDIMSMDLSFDASEIVFSARLKPGEPYHLFRVNVDGSNPCEPGKTGFCQITDGPSDDVYPVYMPGSRIFFMTNENVEVGVKQFRDEYERQVTAQAASITRGGSDRQLGSRNLSHRVSPTLLSDGRVLMTQWDHLGDINEGNLILMNQDLTGQREAYGKEGKGRTNSYLHPREVAPGRVVVVGTSREDTFHAGKLLLVNLGKMGGGGVVDMSSLSEANSSAEDLTPDVPSDMEPSFDGVGRYYDAFPVDDPAKKRFLVSWADGPVQTEVLGMAGRLPYFGIYLYDAIAKTRTPIVVEKGAWATSAIAIQKRAEPPMLSSSSNMAMGTQSTLISALNVYDSSLFKIDAGAVKKVRLIEGFSSEEGVPDDFGLTEHDGAVLLGEVDPGGDGSFKAVVPPNVPIHIQLVDAFGMALANEPIWIQGRGGEARVCGGCHEDRTKTPQVQPGSSALQALGAAQLDAPRKDRISMDFSPGKVRGIPWDKALQPIFDRRCVDCHDGSMNGANRTYTVQDTTGGMMSTFTFTFDLTGKPVNVMVGTQMYSYSASHLSLMGPAMMFEERQVTFVNGIMPKIYVEPGSARGSEVIKMLNPPQRYPSVDMAKRAFMTPVHPSEVAMPIAGHSGKDAKYQLTADEYYLLELMADFGGQYYSRENAPGGTY